jgi:hypothetical protein
MKRLAAGEFGFDNLRHVEVHFRWPHSVEPAYNSLIPSSWNQRDGITFGCRGAVTFETGEKRKKVVTEYLERKGTDRGGIKNCIGALAKFTE